MRASPQEQLQRIEVAEKAFLLEDQILQARSAQALANAANSVMTGYKPPEENMIVIGDYNQPVLPREKETPKSGLSPLAALGIGLLGAAIPAAGIIGYMLNRAPAVVSTVEKIIEKPVEKVITLPGKSFGVDVDMEVIPPR